MPDENHQKIKLLKLLEYLRYETDANHPATTAEICNFLISIGITCDRRTLTKDISLLREFGYAINYKMKGHEKSYWAEESAFTEAQIRFLMDSVQAASFVPREDTEQIQHKLAALLGFYQGHEKLDNLVCFNTRKHSNDSIFSSIDSIEKAIRENCRISFQYFDLNEKHERVYRKEGKRYSVIPFALVYHEDNYYLISYNHRYHSTTNYRVDRMDHCDVQINEKLDEDVLNELQELKVDEYTKEVFRMFGGTPSKVKLRFKKELIGSVYDKFGEDIRIKKCKDEQYELSVNVQVSPTFYGWLFQFGKGMQIVSPEKVAAAYRTLASEVLQGDQGDQMETTESDKEELPF